MPNITERQFRIKVSVDGVNPPPIASWTSLTGGDAKATPTKTFPGGMLPQVVLPEPAERNDAVVQRIFSTTLTAYVVQWEQAIGQAMRVSYTPLDSTGATAGPTVTLHGILNGVKPPEMNANNAATAMLELSMTCQAQASISQ